MRIIKAHVVFVFNSCAGIAWSSGGGLSRVWGQLRLWLLSVILYFLWVCTVDVFLFVASFACSLTRLLACCVCVCVFEYFDRLIDCLLACLLACLLVCLVDFRRLCKL